MTDNRASKLAQGIMPYLLPGEEFALIVATPTPGGDLPDVELACTDASPTMAALIRGAAEVIDEGDYVVLDVTPGMRLS